MFLALLSFAILWEPLDPSSTPSALYGSLHDVPGLFQRSSMDRGSLDHLGVEQWANRNGPLKTKFVFVPSDYPQLSGCTDQGGGLYVTPNRFSDFFGHWFWIGSTQVNVEIEIFKRSNAEAQQGLVDRMGNAPFVIDPLLRTGRRYGPVLGDVCLTAYAPFPSSPEDWPQLDFVRNNVRVRILASAGFPSFSLAHAIDERIRRSE